jgi:penicillin-insensitive murein endopeptidase
MAPLRNLSAALWILLATACGTTAELAQAPAPSPMPPQVAHPPPPLVAETEPTLALELEGDLRVTEPTRAAPRRTMDTELHPLVLPLADHLHPSIDSHAVGSISVGTVTTGYLAHAAEIPLEGPHHRILAIAASRQTRFTTDEMKSLLMCAAQRVGKAHRGQKLHIGNLSRMGGGPLPWSVSHHNGRDVDLAFLARTSSGSPASPDRLFHFNRKLDSTDSRTTMTFDVPANWTLVEGLLTCPGADVQRLFIAAWLRKPLLDYAKKTKKPKAIQKRAAIFLAQPRNAMAHDDHLHLRIACTDEDASEGCLLPGRAPPEAVGQTPGVQERLPKLRKALHNDDPVVRAGAAGLLGLYRDGDSAEGLGAACRDPDTRVRQAALRAALELGHPKAVAAAGEALAVETDPLAMAVGLRGLVQADALPAVLARLSDPRTLQPPADRFDVPQVVVRRLAVQLLSEAESLDVARAAAPLLGDADPSVREAARVTLGRITNHTTPMLAAAIARLRGTATSATPLDDGSEVRLWQAFLDALPADQTREALVLAGFQQQGLPVTVIDRTALPDLVRALLLPGPLRHNAGRLIERIVQNRPMLGRGARSSPETFWPPWLVARRLVTSSFVASLSTESAAPAPTADDAD